MPINLDRICRVTVSDAAEGGDSTILFNSGEPLSLTKNLTNQFQDATSDLTIEL